MTEHVDLAHYSAALDEIHRLRAVLAYEAAVTAAHLGYATFPKSRREAAENQVERMRSAARGEPASHGSVSHMSLRHGLREAGASETLTRWQWEHARAGHACRNCEGVDPESCPFGPKTAQRVLDSEGIR
ncbi:hypothetical protein [Verrucosispora sp. NA02020]|uniref:hypothetical protein n=1 Tax=Verrucosispora sp. NA02020 TaxID=2742132 RepID=UPI00159097A0|nr:hypothetical protein [Verrucosispora sp. NA02020]QKW15428.1 hypothetical protein HUT12_23450 [Verrucosispora sp. NA02020]